MPPVTTTHSIRRSSSSRVSLDRSSVNFDARVDVPQSSRRSDPVLHDATPARPEAPAFAEVMQPRVVPESAATPSSQFPVTPAYLARINGKINEAILEGNAALLQDYLGMVNKDWSPKEISKATALKKDVAQLFHSIDVEAAHCEALRVYSKFVAELPDGDPELPERDPVVRRSVMFFYGLAVSGADGRYESALESHLKTVGPSHPGFMAAASVVLGILESKASEHDSRELLKNFGVGPRVLDHMISIAGEYREHAYPDPLCTTENVHEIADQISAARLLKTRDKLVVLKQSDVKRLKTRVERADLKAVRREGSMMICRARTAIEGLTPHNFDGGSNLLKKRYYYEIPIANLKSKPRQNVVQRFCAQFARR